MKTARQSPFSRIRSGGPLPICARFWPPPAAAWTMSSTSPPFTPTGRTGHTAVGVNWLAGFDFEIKVIARIP
ncbi:hypothetical protein [Ensifer aridi]|uniref:hypothetical protein n=1 Tax=Ensifer aridi TaxID=1708715 RepID=UPI003B830619